MGLLSDGERMSVSLLNSLVSRFLRDTNGLRPVNEMRLFSLSAMLERLVSTLYLIFLKNNLKFNAEELSIPSFLCIFAKELRI